MTLSTFADQTYISLRTFRKSGEAVDTPVWVVGDDTDARQLYIFTRAASGKVKRVRNQGAVEIAPCSMRGVVKGEWLSASAVVDDSAATMDRVVALLLKKYGWQFRATMWTMGKNWKQERTIIVLRA